MLSPCMIPFLLHDGMKHNSKFHNFFRFMVEEVLC